MTFLDSYKKLMGKNRDNVKRRQDITHKIISKAEYSQHWDATSRTRIV